MKLVVGEDDGKIDIDTVPQVMANASPVFRAILQPDRFIEGQKLIENKSFTISLPDDDPLAMKILCDILHLRADKVPLKGMTSKSMAAFATVVDKYDCAFAIHPWPMLWLADLKLTHHSLNDIEHMTVGELPQWIHISCHLGYSDLFRQCTSAIIRKAPKFDAQGGLFLPSCGRLSEMVQNAISTAQQKGMLAFYKVCGDLIEDLLEGKHCTNAKCITTLRGEFNCSSMALGNAILAAQELCNGGGWEQLENWHGSLMQTYLHMLKFAEKLDGTLYVKHEIQCAIRGEIEPVHTSCALTTKVQKQVKSIFEGLQTGLELVEVGNQAYRKNSKLDQSHSSRPVAEGVMPDGEDTFSGLDFRSILLGGEASLM